MTAPHWDEGTDGAYLRYLETAGDTETANRYRLAKQRQHGEDVDYFARRAALALADQHVAERRAVAVAHALEQAEARVAELEEERGDCTTDTQMTLRALLAMCTVGGLLIVLTVFAVIGAVAVFR